MTTHNNSAKFKQKEVCHKQKKTNLQVQETKLAFKPKIGSLN